MKRISRKQVNAIYAAAKRMEIDPDYRVFSVLYNEVADHEFEEDDPKYVAVRIALDYIFDKSDLGPVHGYNEVEAKLNALVA